MIDEIKKNVSSFLKKNKIKVIKVAVCIGFMLLAIFGMNKMGHNNTINVNAEKNNSIYNPKSTIAFGANITEEKLNEDAKIIEQFLQFCNDGNIEWAYNLLSEDCKQILYSSIDEFKEYYLEGIFATKKIYNLQSWISTKENTTYRVRFIDDILTTGDYIASKKYEDYITIDNANNKLSINGYIKSENINKSTSSTDIQITVLKKITYMNYEIITIEVKNNLNSRIFLEDFSAIRTIFLVANGNLKYNLEENEVLKFPIESQNNKIIQLKFNKMYNLNVTDNYIEFSKVIIDSQSNEATENQVNIKANM